MPAQTFGQQVPLAQQAPLHGTQRASMQRSHAALLHPVHLPFWQVSQFPKQTRPQLLQLFLSVWVSTQTPPHEVVPG
jgi:hypothetical protein